MTIPHSQRAAAWARAAMESELRDLAGTSAHRNEALNKAAFAIGQLVGGGLAEHHVAFDHLVEVARDIGLMEPSEKNKTLSTIRRALADGIKEPRRGPEESGAGHGGWRRPNGAGVQQEGDGAREFARRLFDAARPATNTLASVYLHGRSLVSPPPPSMRFHPEAPMPGGSRHPALLAAVTDPVSGEFRALHRIALRPDGSGKAEIEPQKATLGSSRGGVVVCGRLVGVIAVGEGVETALSAVEAGISAIATLSASTLGRVLLPKQVRVVIILGERGSEAAAEAAARLRHAEGRNVSIIYPPAPHKDLNDLLRAEGLLAVEKLMQELK